MKKHVRDLNVKVDYDINSLTSKYPIADVTVSAQITGPVLTAVQKEMAKPNKTIDEFYNSQRKVLDLIWNHCPKVERVIQNGPATIVFWEDGEKTIVKCRECADGKCIHDKGFDANPFDQIAKSMFCGFTSDPEKAIMAAMLKRLYKNYQDVLREALEVEDG